MAHSGFEKTEASNAEMLLFLGDGQGGYFQSALSFPKNREVIRPYPEQVTFFGFRVRFIALFL
jgi:hypothetical protein